jgi:phosphoribosylanthranilate isomerase
VTNIKVCGLTRYEDAALAASLGAWGLGFIFTDKSPRPCPPEKAREIIQRLDNEGFEVEKVGVFLNASAEEINRIAEQTGITVAQMHGTESPEECNRVNIRVLKAIQQLNVDDPAVLDSYQPHWLLIDAPKVGENYGGTGHTADWERARNIASKYPLFLAGNLGPDNIVEALDKVNPLGADLSSSVEQSPGIKDHDKLRKLFHVLTEAGYVR